MEETNQEEKKGNEKTVSPSASQPLSSSAPPLQMSDSNEGPGLEKPRPGKLASLEDPKSLGVESLEDGGLGAEAVKDAISIRSSNPILEITPKVCKEREAWDGSEEDGGEAWLRDQEDEMAKEADGTEGAEGPDGPEGAAGSWDGSTLSTDGVESVEEAEDDNPFDLLNPTPDPPPQPSTSQLAVQSLLVEPPTAQPHAPERQPPPRPELDRPRPEPLELGDAVDGSEAKGEKNSKSRGLEVEGHTGHLDSGKERDPSSPQPQRSREWEVNECPADWEVFNSDPELSRSPSPDIGTICIEAGEDGKKSASVSPAGHHILGLNEHRGSEVSAVLGGAGLRASPHRYPAVARKGGSSKRLETTLPQVTWPKRAEEEYEFLETCGAGSFGEVYKARCRTDGRVVAVKVMESDKWALEEAAILRDLDHECICKLFDCFECPGEGMTCLVMQYASGGDLLERVIKTGALTEKAAADIAKQLLGALKYMHSKGVVHRDLKPENVLYSKESEGKPLLADFGVGKRLHVEEDKDISTHVPQDKIANALRTHSRQIGTVGYSAPEVNTDQGHSFAADVWSFGAMIYVLLCGYHPFDKGDDTDDVIQERVWKGEVLSMEGYGWESISSEAKDFVRRCLVVDVNKRATVDDCLNHPWMSMDFMDVVELVGAFARLKVYHGSRRESRSITAKETATRLKRKREASVASDDGSTGSLTPTPSKNKKAINREFTPSTSTVSEAEGDVHEAQPDQKNVGMPSTKRDRKRAVSSAATEADRLTSQMESSELDSTGATGAGKREKKQEGIHAASWHKGKGAGSGTAGRGVAASPARKREPSCTATDASPGRGKRPPSRDRVPIPSEFGSSSQPVGSWPPWNSSTPLAAALPTVVSPELSDRGQGVDLELLSLGPSASSAASGEAEQQQREDNNPGASSSALLQTSRPSRPSPERSEGTKSMSSDLLTVLEEETQLLGSSPARVRAGLEDLSITASKKPASSKSLLSSTPPVSSSSNPLDSAGLESLSLGGDGLTLGLDGGEGLEGIQEQVSGKHRLLDLATESQLDDTQKRKRERSADLDSPNEIT